MRVFQFACLMCCAVSACSIAEADGMFRRVPEVGEWVRFVHSMTAQLSPMIVDKEVLESPASEAITGTLTLKCVGEEQIADSRHLWIEFRWTTNAEGISEQWVVGKVLVPETQIVEGDLMQHVVRGWSQSDGGDVAEFNPATDEDGEDPVGFVAYMAFPNAHETIGGRQPRRLTINNEEVIANRSMAGDAAPREFKDWSVESDHVRCWLSPDHGFGVAAIEREYVFENAGSEEDVYRVEYRVTMELTETGEDAESDLPEHN